MIITHFGHACVLVDTGRARVLIDPGSFSSGFEEVQADAVLVTHSHFDHFDPSSAVALLDRLPGTRLFIERGADLPASIASERVVRVHPGDLLDIGGTQIDVVGGVHAQIHEDIPLVPNVGYYFRHEQLLHPGDQFIADLDVRVLLAPISGPWQALRDAIDYVHEVGAPIVVPIHEGVLARPQIYIDYLTRLAPAESNVTPLPHGIPSTVD